MVSVQRIRLLGASGSGKSYLANAIANNSDLVHINLDKIVYEYSSDGQIIQKFPEHYRNEALLKISSKRCWVTEGTYYQPWVMNSFKQADLILVLNIPKYIRCWRVIKRAIQNRYSISRLIKHLKYSYLWEKKHKEKAFEALEPFHDKVRVINSFHEVFRLINSS